ncbi:hypothetical protein BSKO_08722 [Bryopsis sp. KO-2023]|nr:hypothetical protein BSKO_08722 [Bryopsis sp. KO-2023]
MADTAPATLDGGYAKFDPQAYLDTYYKGLSSEWVFTKWSKLWLANVHGFFQQCGFSKDSARVLEFGGGPHVIPFFSAAPFARELVFADFAPANREIVGKWQSGDPTSKDYSPYVECLITEFEGGKKEEVPDRIADVRSKMSIIPCDIRNDKDILLGSVEGKFDIISSHLCLECASDTLEQFAGGVKKLKALLNPGGKLLLVTDFGDTFYAVGEKKFPILSMTTDQIEACVAGAEFKKVTKIIFTHETACDGLTKEEVASIEDVSDCGGEICFYCEV